MPCWLEEPSRKRTLPAAAMSQPCHPLARWATRPALELGPLESVRVPLAVISSAARLSSGASFGVAYTRDLPVVLRNGLVRRTRGVTGALIAVEDNGCRGVVLIGRGLDLDGGQLTRERSVLRHLRLDPDLAHYGQDVSRRSAADAGAFERTSPPPSSSTRIAGRSAWPLPGARGAQGVSHCESDDHSQGHGDAVDHPTQYRRSTSMWRIAPLKRSPCANNHMRLSR